MKGKKNIKYIVISCVVLIGLVFLGSGIYGNIKEEKTSFNDELVLNEDKVEVQDEENEEIETPKNQEDTKIEDNSKVEESTKPEEDNKEEESTKVDENNKVEEKLPIEYNGFVLLQSLDANFSFDIRYATTNNFTKQIIYENDLCVLRKETAEKLVKANKILNEKGYKIKVFDGYRNVKAQRKLWSVVSDPNYVADPNKGGSIHNRGGAVDVTIVDLNDNEVVMPSEYDDFTTKAHRNSEMSEEARSNMNILTEAMKTAGFTTINTEWWHFEDGNKSKYKIEDIDMNMFKK